VAWESVATDALASHAHFWELAPGAAWHGFKSVVPGFAITDPNRLTLLTPGFDRRTGEYEAHGIPAPVVAQYLRENRVVAEKFDLNSLLFLLTPGVEASKAGTLVSALVGFKRLHDDNTPLENVIPRFVAANPKRYRGLRLRGRNMRSHRLPHLVADRGGNVVGYAYAVVLRKRPAYRYTVKHSIYVHPDHLHAGIGRALLPALIDACAAAGFRQMIGYIDASNAPSIGLHIACGFRQVGYLPSVAYKFGQSADMIMMQRSLGSGGTTAPDVWPTVVADDGGQ
jgi:L-amino acid N-acyltransferase YncA